MLYSLTTKYAVVALVELAGRPSDRPVLVKELAEAKQIPPAFLAKLVPALVRAGILSSVRGRNGGVTFARPPMEVPLADVVRTIEGEGYFRDCLFSLAPCDGTPNCAVHSVWGGLRDNIIRFLEQTTIGDIARRLVPAEKRSLHGNASSHNPKEGQNE